MEGSAVKAAVLTRLREPLEIQELSDPKSAPDGAIVRVEACGICRSDWHLWQGDWSWLGIELSLPHVLGHEFGGVVEEVGADVRGFKPGDRVTVPFHMACGHCDYCYTGGSNLCLAHGAIGVHFNGGYGRLTSVPSADVNLVHLRESIDFLTAAALGCRFMTAYHGVVDQAQVRPGEWVAVFGIGGVGLSAVQVASAMGARVVAISRSEGKLARAREEGALATVQASGDSTAEAVKDIIGGGAHVTVDALGSEGTALSAILSLRKGGRHVQLGLTGQQEQGAVAVPVDSVVFQELELVGSLGCPTTSYPGMLSLIENGKLEPKRLVSQTIAVEQASDALASMTDFGTVGFHVITQW
jgi:D-arabinose 1-dehydrogenase-like Zn-dependent alcohol dehydrogenase